MPNDRSAPGRCCRRRPTCRPPRGCYVRVTSQPSFPGLEAGADTLARRAEETFHENGAQGTMEGEHFGQSRTRKGEVEPMQRSTTSARAVFYSKMLEGAGWEAHFGLFMCVLEILHMRVTAQESNDTKEVRPVRRVVFLFDASRHSGTFSREPFSETREPLIHRPAWVHSIPLEMTP